MINDIIVTGSILKSVDRKGISMLDVFIDTKAKDVVAHAIVQKYLTEVWSRDLVHWPSWKVALLFFAMLLLPPLWIGLTFPVSLFF